jgi:hypothetical protein
VAVAVDETKYSMVGSFAGCCVRAASGVAAAPPSKAINSRRARPLVWMLKGKMEFRLGRNSGSAASATSWSFLEALSTRYGSAKTPR